jgi:hypothetical protein
MCSYQELEQPCSISIASLLPSEEANSFASGSWSVKLQKQKASRSDPVDRDKM